MKKILAITIATIVLTFGASLSIYAASNFSDVADTKYESSVSKLTTLNIINGFPDGTFRPNETVTRAQLAKMLVEGLKMKSTSTVQPNFTDLSSDHWAYSYIKIAVDNKLVVGYPDGSFRPESNVSYAEAMTMILRALNLESKMTDKTWPSGYMNEATKQGLLNSVTYANADAAATRGEVSISLYNMVNKKENDELQAQIEKQKEEEKREAEAKKNALEYGLVTSVTESKSVYTVKLKSDKTKYEIASIDGSSKISSKTASALEGTVIGYKEDDNEIDIEANYLTTDLDKAKYVTKISGKTTTFSDKTSITTSDTTLIDKYKYHTFVEVDADYDEDDGTISFTKVTKLGTGLDNAKFEKGDRIIIDDSNNTIVIVKGFTVSDTIKKGKITDTGSVDTSDYEYGLVKTVNTKKELVKIDKTEYTISSKSTFTEDTFVVYTVKEDDDEDIATLVKSFSPTLLDNSVTGVITKVSGKAGAQTITYGSSKTLKASDSKYEDYVFNYN